MKTSFFSFFFTLIFVFFVAGAWAEEIQGTDNIGKKYYYATATGYDVKLRKGPGTQFEENKIRLHRHAYANAPAGIAYDDYIYGLIVDDTVVQGDATCSAWQKVVVVHTAWDSEEMLEPLCETFNGTNSFKCHEDVYICKDFIKISPVKYEGYLQAKKSGLIESLRKINYSH